LFERCQNVLAEIEDLQAAASGARTELAGTLRVDLPVFYGKRFVMPILARLAAQHPGLKLDIRLSDVKIDLIREGIDLAVRIGQLSDSSLVAKRIDQQHLVLCASPAYLAQHGRPETVADLARHAAVRFRLPTSGRDRPWQLTCDGEAIVLSPPAHVRIDETEGLLEALTLGLGIGQIPDILVQYALDRGELIELLPQSRPAPMPIHILYASGRLMPARVRLVIEALETLRLRESRH
jgi:DNA-binding transcriptional LysR family regulator